MARGTQEMTQEAVKTSGRTSARKAKKLRGAGAVKVARKAATQARKAGSGRRTSSPSPGKIELERIRADRILASFDSLRRLAAAPGRDEDDAERISDEAWTLVESAEPVRIAYAKELLGVSDQTVRTWIDRGILEGADSDSVKRVTLDSVAEVKEIADELRAMHASDPRLASAVIAKLEGETLAGDERLRESLAQMRRGERG